MKDSELKEHLNKRILTERDVDRHTLKHESHDDLKKLTLHHKRDDDLKHLHAMDEGY